MADDKRGGTFGGIPVSQPSVSTQAPTAPGGTFGGIPVGRPAASRPDAAEGIPDSAMLGALAAASYALSPTTAGVDMPANALVGPMPEPASYVMPGTEIPLPTVNAQGERLPAVTNRDVQQLQADVAATSGPGPFMTPDQVARRFDQKFGTGAAEQYIGANADDRAPEGGIPYGTGLGYLVNNPVTRGVAEAAYGPVIGVENFAADALGSQMGLGLDAPANFLRDQAQNAGQTYRKLDVPANASGVEGAIQGFTPLATDLAAAAVLHKELPEPGNLSANARLGDIARYALSHPTTITAGAVGAGQALRNAGSREAYGEDVSPNELVTESLANTAMNFAPLNLSENIGKRALGAAVRTPVKAGRAGVLERALTGAGMGGGMNTAYNALTGRPLDEGALPATILGAGFGALPAHPVPVKERPQRPQSAPEARPRAKPDVANLTPEEEAQVNALLTRNQSEVTKAPQEPETALPEVEEIAPENAPVEARDLLEGMRKNRENAEGDEWINGHLRDESVARGKRDADQLGLREPVEHGLEGRAVHFVHDEDGVPDDLRKRMKPVKKGNVRYGTYDPRTGEAYIFTKHANTPERALWTAIHEVGGHRGFRQVVESHPDVKVGGRTTREAYNSARRLLLQNPTVAKMADAIGASRKSGDRMVMAEEAAAELQAARRTGNWDEIQRKYGVVVPKDIREGKGAIANFVRRVKRIFNAIVAHRTGKASDVFTDADVHDMLDSMWQASRGEGRPGTGEAMDQQVFHGTQHRGIEKEGFKLNRIGTGEGNQSYGWGIYFAGKPDVAEGYRKRLTVSEDYVDGELYDPYNARHLLARTLDQNSGDLSATRNYLEDLAKPGGNSSVRDAAKRALDLLANDGRPTIESIKPNGQLYRAEIPEDSDLLDWDKPLSEQSVQVREKLNNVSGGEVFRESMQPFEDTTGNGLYRALVKDTGSPQAASRALEDAGIPGLRYLDGDSRQGWSVVTDGDHFIAEHFNGKKREFDTRDEAVRFARAQNAKKTYNYVIWDEAHLNNDVQAMDSQEPAERPKSFADQVHERLSSGDRRGGMLDMGRTPAILRRLGFDDLPLRMTPNVLFKLASGKGGERASLTERQISRLPEFIDEPQAVLRSSRGDDSVVVVTNAKDSEGNPIVVTIAKGQAGAGNPELRVNVTTSAYGKNDASWFAREARAGRALYADKEKALGRQVGSGDALFRATEQGSQGHGENVLGPDDLRKYRAEQRGKNLNEPLASEEPEGIETPKTRGAHYTDGQKAFMRKAGLKHAVDESTLADRAMGAIKDQLQRVAGMKEGLGDRLKQGYVNQYHGLFKAVKEIGGLPDADNPAIAAELINTASTMEAVLKFGAPEWHEGGLRVARDDVPGLLEGLQPVRKNLAEWLGWMVARRAKLLKEQGRENNMTDEDIRHGLSLADGHETEFKRAAYNYLRLKNSILDFAEKSGVIDPEARKAWDHVEYIPFYRDMESGAGGPGTRRGLANQSSGIRTLKGGEAALKDPLENIVANFTRLVDASTKNMTAVKAVDNLGSTFFTKAAHQVKPENIPMDQVRQHLMEQGVDEATLASMPPDTMRGMARMLSIKPPEGDDVVRVMRNGHAEYYHVTDPLLYRAMTALNDWRTPTWMKPFIWFKHILTAGATATPDFWVRNLLRDTGEAWATSGDRFIPVWDTLRGAVSDIAEDDFVQDLMMAGASFREGYFRTGDMEDTSKAIKRVLRNHGQSEATATKIAKTILNPKRTWDAYRRVAEATEMGSRIGIARSSQKGGGSYVGSMREAKDLLNFQRHGDTYLANMLIRMIPFLNARIQGADRLLRVGTTKGRRGRMATRVAMMAMASTALYWWNQKMYQDAYDELPEWDKDAYWHIAPGTDAHIRIPKPFELGLIGGTLPERMLGSMKYAITGRGSHPDEDWDSLMRAVTGTMAFNPIPQALMPAAEVYFNKDFYFGGTVENDSDQFKLPKDRYSVYTSPTMREASKGMAAVLGKGHALSPKQLEHLWRGYTAGMGMYALAATDWLVRKAKDQPATPAGHLRDFPLVHALYEGGAPLRTTKYVDEFYRFQVKAQTAMHTVYGAIDNNKAGRARNVAKNNAWLLGEPVKSKQAKHGFVFGGMRQLNKVRDAMADIRRESARIYGAPDMTPEQKRAAIDKLNKQRNDLARRTVRQLRERQRKASAIR